MGEDGSVEKKRPLRDEGAYKMLEQVRNTLLDLHKTLMDSERVSYEAVFGPISSPNKFLQLLIQDPWFAWLRSISELVALMDESMDGKEPLTQEVARRLTDQVKNLLKPSEEGAGFARQYYDALQRDANVVMAHAEVQKTIAASQSKG
jgi:hypothetical protein